MFIFVSTSSVTWDAYQIYKYEYVQYHTPELTTPLTTNKEKVYIKKKEEEKEEAAIRFQSKLGREISYIKKKIH